MIYSFSKKSTWALCYQFHILLFVRKILEHFLAIRQRFWWPRWKHTQATRTAAQAQHSTAAVQHSSHRHHPNAQPNNRTLLGVGYPTTRTLLVGGKRSNDGYQPWPARCAAPVLIYFTRQARCNEAKESRVFFCIWASRLIVPRLSAHSWINPLLAAENTLV